MGSLKSPWKSSTETIMSKLLSFFLRKSHLVCMLATDRQTDEQMDSPDALGA